MQGVYINIIQTNHVYYTGPREDRKENIYSGLRTIITNNTTSLILCVWSDKGIQIMDYNE